MLSIIGKHQLLRRAGAQLSPARHVPTGGSDARQIQRLEVMGGSGVTPGAQEPIAPHSAWQVYPRLLPMANSSPTALLPEHPPKIWEKHHCGPCYPAPGCSQGEARL